MGGKNKMPPSPLPAHPPDHQAPADGFIVAIAMNASSSQTLAQAAGPSRQTRAKETTLPPSPSIPTHNQHPYAEPLHHARPSEHANLYPLASLPPY